MKNEITIENRPETSSSYSPGDLFESADGELLMLVDAGVNSFATIILETGVAWNGPCRTIEGAINNTTFLGRGAKIKVTF